MAAEDNASVTPAGVRDGDPTTLKALYARRGGAVLAYCEHTCAAGQAIDAAAEAFAAFRAGVIGTDDLATVDPEALLLSTTRRAAVRRAPRPAQPPAAISRIAGRRATHAACDLVPELLVARVEHRLSAADERRLERHIGHCAQCRAAEQRFRAAEAAYAEAVQRPLPAAALSAIVSAMELAGPEMQAHAAELVSGIGDADIGWPDDHPLAIEDDEPDADEPQAFQVPPAAHAEHRMGGAGEQPGAPANGHDVIDAAQIESAVKAAAPVPVGPEASASPAETQIAHEVPAPVPEPQIAVPEPQPAPPPRPEVADAEPPPAPPPEPEVAVPEPPPEPQLDAALPEPQLAAPRQPPPAPPAPEAPPVEPVRVPRAPARPFPVRPPETPPWDAFSLERSGLPSAAELRAARRMRQRAAAGGASAVRTLQRAGELSARPGVHLPRPQRSHGGTFSPLVQGQRYRHLHGHASGWMVPAGVLGVALVVALAIAGVFSGSPRHNAGGVGVSRSASVSTLSTAAAPPSLGASGPTGAEVAVRTLVLPTSSVPPYSGAPATSGGPAYVPVG